MISQALPEHWTVEPIAELNIDGVTNVNPLNFPDEVFEYYSIPAYQDGETPQMTKGSEILSQKLLIPPQCVLFGKLNPRVQKVWNVKQVSHFRCIASTEWLPVVPKDGIDPDFVYFLLYSNWVMPIAQSLVSGSTPSRQRVEPKAFYEILVPVPDFHEQKKIASVLGLFEKAVQFQSGHIEYLQALKRTTMRTLFTRGLRGEPQKETEIGPVPESWSIISLEGCAFVQTGAAKGRKFGDSEVAQVPYLRVANVQDGYLDLMEMKSITIRKSEIDRYRLQHGDVVLTEGGDFDKLGRGFIWRGQLELCVHQNHVFAVRTDRNRLLPDFFAYQAQSDYGKAYFLKVAHKTTNLACINTAKLKAFPVLIPTLREQREIVSILDAIDRKIDLHRRKRAVLDDLFKALLHKLMTGEIRVADLNLSVLQLAQDSSID